MHAAAAGRELGCTSCHDAHASDTRRAATDACVGCHADDHSRAFPGTPHAAAGVTCATCHMPGGEHNQNDNLRPSSKMVRTVCLDCHTMDLTLDALADAALVRRNFDGPPAVHVRSLEMVEAREKSRRRDK
jgi:predicted CXXCH cytochrome family protein